MASPRVKSTYTYFFTPIQLSELVNVHGGILYFTTLCFFLSIVLLSLYLQSAF
jgi:hypothetical protein